MELRKLKRIGIIIVVLSLALLIFQNLHDAPISFFFLNFDIPVSLLILITLLAGFALGMIAAINMGKEKKSEEATTQAPPAADSQ